MVTERQVRSGTPRKERVRDEARVLVELTVFSRRVRADARDVHPELSYVDFTLLRIVQDNPGVLAGDLADAARIDKSTASRQLSALVRRGLLERTGSGGREGKPLELTAQGRRITARAQEAQQALVAQRLADWSAADVAVFADLLARYNEADAPSA
ncbi:MarR family winged helix-turn-helix transcriptional regulator [Branchiibius cervicis]|uniref:MarR family winged helix-turn-helix transcriptional regulator n=1 Tax=Branchiibius cervicis TaxID=908252 RepID=A0ABW2AVA5_9MICO